MADSASAAQAAGATASPFRVLVLNQISGNGLQRLTAGRYLTGKDLAQPDAILVRSADMHGIEIASSVKAIARAGAGTNNIPVKAMSARGVPVFNAPGANANAVKELRAISRLRWPSSPHSIPPRRSSTRPSRTARRISPVSSSPARRWASSVWARWAAWWRTPPSSWE
jgi:hypothetical protein